MLLLSVFHSRKLIVGSKLISFKLRSLKYLNKYLQEIRGYMFTRVDDTFWPTCNIMTHFGQHATLLDRKNMIFEVKANRKLDSKVGLHHE